MDVDANSWGSLIRVLREEHNLSQRTLARLAGVHRMTLRRIEAGTGHGDIVVIEQRLLALGYELEALPTRDSWSHRCGRQILATTDPVIRSRLAAEALRGTPPSSTR